MSDYKVPYTTILEIKEHPNADRLSIATVYGFQVVVQKGKYQPGNKIIFVPIDSILPQEIEDIIFPPDSKIKLHHHRIRQIRIRGLASQGMIIDPEDILPVFDINVAKLEEDLAGWLGITKYEPPEIGPSRPPGNPAGRNRHGDHPLFHKYNGLDNIKWFPTLFTENEEVIIQEKLHGTNARASMLKYEAVTLWQKLLKFLRLTPEVEKLYGSNNVQISRSASYNGYYNEDIYGRCFKQLDIFSKMKIGESVYGEIIGPSIQKNYQYSLTKHKFVLFDVKILKDDGKQMWLLPEQVEAYAKMRGFEYVPVLYRGKYTKDLAYALTKGPSQYDPNTKVREGIVIKGRLNYDIEGNKRALKWVNEDYLDDKSNSDNH